MKKLLFTLIAATIATPVLADPEIRQWNTPHSLGCMLMRECVEGTTLINSVADLEGLLPYSNFTPVAEEADAIIKELAKMGVNVYLADSKYFPRGHAGVYYTVGNDFFLNASWSDDPYQMIQTLRHEAWHAAQDAMAGSIDNSMIAVIRDGKDVPQEFKLLVEIQYPPSARPWEQEAKWAGETPGMTLEVLKIINETNGKPWTVIEPTPLTRLWLQRNGYL